MSHHFVRATHSTALRHVRPHPPRLGAIAETDARQMHLCPSCEGLLLTAAAGLPLPMTLDEGGLLIDGELYVDATLDRVFADTHHGRRRPPRAAGAPPFQDRGS